MVFRQSWSTPGVGTGFSMRKMDKTVGRFLYSGLRAVSIVLGLPIVEVSPSLPFPSLVAASRWSMSKAPSLFSACNWRCKHVGRRCCGLEQIYQAVVATVNRYSPFGGVSPSADQGNPYIYIHIYIYIQYIYVRYHICQNALAAYIQNASICIVVCVQKPNVSLSRRARRPWYPKA